MAGEGSEPRGDRCAGSEGKATPEGRSDRRGDKDARTQIPRPLKIKNNKSLYFITFVMLSEKE